MTRYEEAREAIAKALFNDDPISYTGSNGGGCVPWRWDTISAETKEHYLHRADALLSLKGTDGKPLIVVPSTDQNLPALGPETSGADLLAYLEHAQLLSAAGFVKVEKP